MAGLNQESLRVPKTFKFFVNGKFVRTESGRSFPVYTTETSRLYAHLSRASRKDMREAVEAAKKAQPSWSAKTAFNRSQILYRAAEMLEAKRTEFTILFCETLGQTPEQADEAVDAGIDALVYYAGFADKFQQVMGSVNPVSGPHHNFTTAEPVGVVGLIPSERFRFGDLMAEISAILCSGNALVVCLATEGAAAVGPLAEVFATSDFPAGVVNLLTGDLTELATPLASHMDLDSLSYQGESAELLGKLRRLGVPNMKRVIAREEEKLSLKRVLNFVEYKTIWHPIGT